MRAPQAVVIGGPNGAGKTSSAPEILQGAVNIEAFVNADVIAQGLAGFDPQSAAVEAGRIMLGRLAGLARQREDFAFESTLAGRSAHRFLFDLGAAGYDVHVFYLWLPAAELAIARVRRRVQAGGHDVPVETIRRRFSRSLVNFRDLYRPVSTTWRLYDGSSVGLAQLIASGHKAGEPIVLDKLKWSTFQSSSAEAS